MEMRRLGIPLAGEGDVAVPVAPFEDMDAHVEPTDRTDYFVPSAATQYVMGMTRRLRQATSLKEVLALSRELRAAVEGNYDVTTGEHKVLVAEIEATIAVVMADFFPKQPLQEVAIDQAC